jgi:hypothetical protein
MTAPIDAYRFPQQLRPGCTHQLGCRCVAPYHLRASSPAEEAREGREVARIPSPSAICPLIGCKVSEAHVHEVIA